MKPTLNKVPILQAFALECKVKLVDGKALDNRFYRYRVHMETNNKAFAYRVPIGAYNY